MSYSDCKTAVKTMWSTHWLSHPTVPVYWHENLNPTVPDAGSTDHWIMLLISFGTESTAAFGAGVRQRERELSGFVTTVVFSKRGIGEDETLQLLDDALDVFRGRIQGSLVFAENWIHPFLEATADGAWWQRSGSAKFRYRFRG